MLTHGGLHAWCSQLMNFPDLNLWESCSHWKCFPLEKPSTCFCCKPEALPSLDPSSPFRDSTSRQKLRILKRSAIKLVYMKPPFWGSKTVKYQQLHMAQLTPSTFAAGQACSSCSLAAYLSYLNFGSRFFSFLGERRRLWRFPRQCIKN